jgi:uncharacterized protein (DUF849 family)
VVVKAMRAGAACFGRHYRKETCNRTAKQDVKLVEKITSLQAERVIGKYTYGSKKYDCKE